MCLNKSCKKTQRGSPKKGKRECRVFWRGPRMHDKLLLFIIHEVEKANRAGNPGGIPWDNIAERIKPGYSGSALKQHLRKIRLELLAKGHIVPPLLRTNNVSVVPDDSVRGYVQIEGTNGAQRPVLFTETFIDPTEETMEDNNPESASDESKPTFLMTDNNRDDWMDHDEDDEDEEEE